MDLLILCGGKGTRLASITHGRQKCSLDINGKPFLLYIIDTIIKLFSVKSICLCVGHSAKDITSIDFSGYINKGIEVTFSTEEESLGTGGAIKKAINEKFFSDELIVCNGDSICDIKNLQVGYQNYARDNSGGIIASALISNAERYGTLIVDKNNKIQKFEEKKQCISKGIINAGIYILNKRIIRSLLEAKDEDYFSLEKDIFPFLIDSHALYIADPTDTFIDIGVPEDFSRASHFLNSIV